MKDWIGTPHERDVYLSDAMATSAAAVDHHMGALEGGQEMFKDLKVTLGIAMGTSIIGDPRQEKHSIYVFRLVLIL